MSGLKAPAAVECGTCDGGGEIPAAFALPGLGALLTPRRCPDPVHDRPQYSEGDVVRVRDEQWLSVVDQPTDGPPNCDPEQLPPMSTCCVPVALVRPYDDPDGARRWVQQSDLEHAKPDD